MTRFAGAVVLLLAVVAWGWGGYDPWAILTLEIGSVLLLLALIAFDPEERKRDPEATRSRFDAWRRLPFWLRHPELASVVRLLTLGGFPRRKSSPEVEILLPGSGGRASVELDLAREGFLLGYPVRRTGLMAPLALVTLWISLSLVPLSRPLLASLSPEAARLRGEAERLVASETPASPWSLAPYQSLRALWIWIAVLALFYTAFRCARSPKGATRLSLGLVLLGAASGTLGIAGFFSDLQVAHGQASEALRATGSFGNPNHYAAFQSMLLLTSLGFLAWLRERAHKAGTGRPRGRSNEGGLAAIAGLAILLLALGLLLSLSRSGIAFALVGALVFVSLARHGVRPGASRHATLRALLVLALAVGGVALWIGVEPLVGRFTGLSDEWDKEATRIQVWRDSVPALSDYWRTGSGLSSFRYVGARYRSFGGRIFYSWAHNDYLQLGIELGLPGFVLLLWMGIVVVKGARRVRSDLEPDRSLLALHAGFGSALVAVALHSLTDFSLHLPANLALAAVLAGAVVGMERRV
ncbi:MAG TPA: O-antigen ligase family protein [Vicinamibacteria bacterium]|jgi:O-antigen ligase